MIEKVEKYYSTLLTSSQVEKLSFHNLEHTQEVVQSVKYIAAAMDINLADTNLLVVAAWFHDTGFSKTYKGHEEAGMELAKNFLVEIGLDNTSIKRVCDYIYATKMPQVATTKLAEILCDADIFHTSNLNFYYRKLLLRREWEVFCDISMSDKEWHELNLDFLQNFHFRSSYGKKFLESGKQENVQRVKQILKYY